MDISSTAIAVAISITIGALVGFLVFCALHDTEHIDWSK